MTTELKNLYEDLIKGMMIEGINGMTPELRKLIENSPVNLQRSMILEIMEENNVEHRLLCSKIQKTITANNSSETKHIRDVVKMLREYVEVSDTEVKEFGEVMTPITLVEEMLDTLPDSVWTNPNLKWLDPCNGVGTFVSVIIHRLMKGLVTFEPNDELRYKHIMENMIYVCELQSKNCFLYMYAFDPRDEYALNIYNGSYLSDGFNRHMSDCGVEKFDVIVMNPPYNSGSDNVRGIGHTLWDKFVMKSLEISLIKDGYLVAVHPDGWRNLGKAFDKVKKLLKSKEMLYLEIHDKGDGIKTFGASTTYDFYCVRNSENQGNFNTKIKCMDGTTERVDISKMEFIPNGMYDTFKKVIAKGKEERVSLLHSESAYEIRKQHMSKEQTEEFKYPVVYVTYKDGSVNFRYSNINTRGHFGISKVIFSNGISTPITDSNGEYAMTQFSYAIVDDVNNLERIKQAMLNPEFLKLMSFSDGMTGVGRHRYNRKAIALFRKDFWIDFL
jgi:hypothetical protein